MGEGGKKLAWRPRRSCVTHTRARLPQQLKWWEDSQRALHPGMLGWWPLAGVYPGWLRFKIRPSARSVLLMSSAKSGGEPSSQREAFSPSSRLQEGEEELTYWGPAVPVKKSISDSWVRKPGRSCTRSAQPWTKALSPVLKEECKTKETAWGRQKTPPPAAVRSFGILYMRVLSHTAFSKKRKQPL